MRTLIRDFMLANPIYRNASVSFYTVSGGLRTNTLATLYSARSGLNIAANPQQLNSDGRFKAPVYTEEEVVAVVSGINIPSHETGVINLVAEGVTVSPFAETMLALTAATLWVAQLGLVMYTNVKDPAYGALGDGTTDDTAGIQAAIDAVAAAGRGVVFLPPGIYNFTELNITSDNIVLLGCGKYTSVLNCTSVDGGVIVNGTDLGMVSNLGFLQSVDSTDATSALLKLTSVFRFTVERCMFNGYVGASNYAHNLLHLSGNSIFVNLCDGVGGKTTGMKISGGTGGYFVSQCLFNQIGVVGVPLYVENVVGGDVQIDNCDFLQGQNCIVTNTNFSTFANAFFDSAQSGVSISGCEFLSFTACQFANRVDGGSGDGTGIIFGNSKNCVLGGCVIVNCGTDGIQIANDCETICLDSCTIVDNNITNTAGKYGVNVAGGAQGFRIKNCTIGNGSALLAGFQQYGIAINTGASDNFIVTGNDLRNNVVGGMIDLSTGVAKIVRDNITSGATLPAVMGRLPNIPIGPVAYNTLGTNAVHVAGTIYVAEIFIPTARNIAGIAILNGATVGTDKGIVALYGPDGGAALATSTLAGATTAGANAFQEYALTAAKLVLNPGRYFIAFQCNGTTDTTRRIAASTYLNWTKTFTGAFGTIGSLVVPTTFTADAGPIGYLY